MCGVEGPFLAKLGGQFRPSCWRQPASRQPIANISALPLQFETWKSCLRHQSLLAVLKIWPALMSHDAGRFLALWTESVFYLLLPCRRLVS